MHVCDGQTDRRTEFSSLDRVCIACSEVKIRSIDFAMELLCLCEHSWELSNNSTNSMSLRVDENDDLFSSLLCQA